MTNQNIEMFRHLSGMDIITNPYMGEFVVPAHPHPERIKRYKKRTMKRWRKSHPNYYKAKGEYVMIDSRLIMCHPDDAESLRVIITERNNAANSISN